MNPHSHSAMLVVSATLAGCNGQVLDVGSTGQALVQHDGGLTEPTTIATLRSVPANMASDGVTLYWVESLTTNLMAMPVQGGQPTSLATTCSPRFLAVDATNVYFIRSLQLYAALKTTTNALMISDGSGSVTTAAVRRTKAFWAEAPDQQPRLVEVKAASVTDRVASVVGQFPRGAVPPFQMGVTPATLFVATDREPLAAFSLTGGGTLDGGPPQRLDSSCGILVSDDGAAYCVPPGGPVTRTGSDGTTTILTTVTGGTAAALDATYLYFGDKPASGGLLLKIPKLGGPPTIIAREEVTALAVDDSAIYWATPNGYIRRLLK